MVRVDHFQKKANGPHRSSKKQFQSLNTYMYAQSYDYTIKLIKIYIWRIE